MSHSTSLSHPVFVPNQVLTDTQLNHMREYLDGQILMTRTRLTGTGIVCGLQVNYERSEPGCDPEEEFHAIYVSAGYGITSEGYILELSSETRYTRYRRFDSEGYDLWSGSPTSHPIFELGEHNADQDEFSELTEVQVHKRVVVLYLDRVVEDLKSCAVTDCSNKGSHVHFILRALLVPESILQGEELCEGLVDERLYLPRFYTGLEADGRDENCILGGIQNTDDILGAYGKLALTFAKNLRDRLIAKLQVLRTLKQPPDSSIGVTYDTPVFLNIGDKSDIIYRLYNEAYSPDVIFCEGQDPDDYNQYHYAFVRDLGCAYAEFLACWCELVMCCHGARRGERHLMLSHVPDRLDEQGRSYRDEFQPAAIKNVIHETWGRCRKLILRMMAMIETFDIANVSSLGALSRIPDIKITPSHTMVYSLGAQAIPFYYDISNNDHAAELLDCWQPKDCCAIEPLHSYHFQAEDELGDYRKRPLYYDIAKCTLFRIEGHIGKSPADAVGRIESLRRRNNLDFEVFVVYLSETVDEQGNPFSPVNLYADVIEHLCGMEHIGGVYKGGTLILIVDPRCPGFTDEVVVADFALPWKVSCCAERGEPQQVPPYPGSDVDQGFVNVRVVDDQGFYVAGAVVTITGPGVEQQATTPAAVKVGDPMSGVVSFTGLKVGREYEIDASHNDFERGAGVPRTVVAALTEGRIHELVLVKPATGAESQEAVPVDDIAVAPHVDRVPPGLESAIEKRQKDYLKELYDLNQGGDFQRNRTYQSVLDFAGLEKVPVDDLSKSYSDVLGRVKSVYGRTSGPKQFAYEQMAIRATHHYLDRAVLENKDRVDDGILTLIQEQVEALAGLGMDVGRLRNSWNSDELKDAGGAVDQIRNVM